MKISTVQLATIIVVVILGFVSLSLFISNGDLRKKVESLNAADTAIKASDSDTKVKISDLVSKISSASGIVSVKGDAGEQGLIGPSGIPGEKGEIGPSGVPGEKGDKGDTGAAGPAGARGDKGDTGNTGSAGANGVSGYEYKCQSGYVHTGSENWGGPTAYCSAGKKVIASQCTYSFSPTNTDRTNLGKVIMTGESSRNITYDQPGRQCLWYNGTNISINATICVTCMNAN